MNAAARSIKYKGPKTLEHIARQSQRQADQLISEIAYDASNPEFEIEDPHSFLLTSYLEQELLKRYDKGIVSFTEKVDCPLMWSHYGDQHKGICVGYSVPDRPLQLRRVEYDGSRLISASDISRMLNGDKQAQERVDLAVLFRKAAPWKYELEWRLIGGRGSQNSLLELEEIIFGVRCDSAVAFTIVKAFEGRSRPIKFYEMREVSGTFELSKCALDIEEAMATWPKRSLSSVEAFEAMDASLVPSSVEDATPPAGPSEP